MGLRYYSYNTYLREKFGDRVHRLSLDAGFSCPNIDGEISLDGCIYCNNKAFSRYASSKKRLVTQITESLNYHSQKSKIKKFIAYFQAYSSTYADIKVLKETYAVIKQFPQIVGLCISTRPDCIDKEKLKLIADYQSRFLVWLEYGLQTTHNTILKNINRGHDYESFLGALELTRKFDINTGVHMILGLPDMDYNMIITDARRLAKLDIQGVKLHILHILKNTLLEQKYSRGKVSLLSEDEYIKYVCDYLQLLPKDVVILRLAATAAKDYLVAPKWINNKHRILKAIDDEFARRGTSQGVGLA